MNALILDDGKGGSEPVRSCLEEQGMRVAATTSVAKARRIIGRTPPALIVVLGNPEGSGEVLSFADWVQAQARAPSVIMIADRGTPVRQCGSVGVAALLERPVDPYELARQVQRVLAERATPPGPPANHVIPEPPLVRLGKRGEVLSASPAGQRVLDTVVDPAVTRPVTHVDSDLLTRLNVAAGQLDAGGQTVVFRRDGELGHHMAQVRQHVEDGESVLTVSFVESGGAPAGDVDDLWRLILQRAAVDAARADRRPPVSPGAE
ncbi:MAG: hypothetical protein PVJ57_15160 [Phycisphaerae bacterium]|jgi:DNA-binding response OmpR family regulator